MRFSNLLQRTVGYIHRLPGPPRVQLFVEDTDTLLPLLSGQTVKFWIY